MTWNETHERTRIIREVEASAAVDMTGRLPWREDYAPSFDGPAALVAALRARWERMCEAQLDVLIDEDQLRESYGRLRRTHAGVLAILKAVDEGVLTTVPAMSVLPTPARRQRRLAFRLHGGPVLPVRAGWTSSAGATRS